MIVDDIEDDAEPESVGAIDKPAEVVGAPVKLGRRKPSDAVVAPVTRSGKGRHRHHLDQGNAGLRE